jgi:hypothetical protein
MDPDADAVPPNDQLQNHIDKSIKEIGDLDLSLSF